MKIERNTQRRERLPFSGKPFTSNTAITRRPLPSCPVCGMQPRLNGDLALSHVCTAKGAVNAVRFDDPLEWERWCKTGVEQIKVMHTTMKDSKVQSVTANGCHIDIAGRRERCKACGHPANFQTIEHLGRVDEDHRKFRLGFACSRCSHSHKSDVVVDDYPF